MSDPVSFTTVFPNDMNRLNNLTPAGADALLKQDPEISERRDEFLEQVARVAGWDGNPNRLDTGWEIGQVGEYLVRDDRYNQLLLAPIPKEDFSRYCQFFYRPAFERSREDILDRYGIKAERYPDFRRWMEALPVQHFTDFRGLPVFVKLAEVLREQLPGVVESRKLRVLYPGSGSHVAPLGAVFSLMDAGVIDRAELIYTEINDLRIDHLQFVLARGHSSGILQGVSHPQIHINPAEPGAEFIFNVLYRGHPVVIRFALQKSGERYYRPEYLASADLIVIHDPGDGDLSDSASLMATILQDRRQMGLGHAQLVVVEGEGEGFYASDQLYFPDEPHRIRGVYGHCEGYHQVGEVDACVRKSAFVVPLHDPRVAELAVAYPTEPDLTKRLLMPQESDIRRRIEGSLAAPAVAP